MEQVAMAAVARLRVMYAPALVETVPGAPDASLESIDVKVGSAVGPKGKHSPRDIYYETVPPACPEGGFPVKTELAFEGVNGSARVVVAKEIEMPCPKRAARYTESQPAGSEVPVVQTPVPGTGGVVAAPPNLVCLSRRHFTIHVVQKPLPGGHSRL